MALQKTTEMIQRPLVLQQFKAVAKALIKMEQNAVSGEPVRAIMKRGKAAM